MIRRRKPIARRSAPKRGGKIKRPKAKTHKWLMTLAHDLMSLRVRSRRECEIGRCGGGPRPVTGLQYCHGFGKKCYPSVRFEEWNAFAGCPECHAYYTPRSESWASWLIERWGLVVFEERHRAAQGTVKYQLIELIAVLWLDPLVHDALRECSDSRIAEICSRVKKVVEAPTE